MIFKLKTKFKNINKNIKVLLNKTYKIFHFMKSICIIYLMIEIYIYVNIYKHVYI